MVQRKGLAFWLLGTHQVSDQPTLTCSKPRKFYHSFFRGDELARYLARDFACGDNIARSGQNATLPQDPQAPRLVAKILSAPQPRATALGNRSHPSSSENKTPRGKALILISRGR